MVDFTQYGVPDNEVSARTCPKCGTLHYPAPMVCTRCGQRRDPSGLRFPTWDEVPLRGKCTLLSWTRVYTLPADFSDRYLVFGIVEFENGLRASGRLLCDAPETGMTLNARTAVVRDGRVPERGLVFDPAGTTGGRKGGRRTTATPS